MIIMLPWPPKELSPNKRLHWAVRNPFKVLYRDTCYRLTVQSKAFVTHDGPIPITIDFYPPDRRHRDDDNMISAFKAGRDGLANALGVNDRRFQPFYRFNDPIKGGKVVVSL
jgi:crossover junction endodeoxyribonuclease RusA